MADAKITALTENTSPIGTDLVVIVDDPSGSALTQKITLTNLRKLFIHQLVLASQVFN